MIGVFPTTNMKHNFELTYEIDCTVGEAVAAYLDAEHYDFLHKSYAKNYKVISQEDNEIIIEHSWHFAGLRMGQISSTKYLPPATFLNYNIKPFPWWLPSIHHLIKTTTELKYYPTAEGERCVSHLKVELTYPFFVWPFRNFLEKKLCDLKIAKDLEDVEMISRQQKIFGKGNLNHFRSKHVFLLHKELFVKHYLS